MASTQLLRLDLRSTQRIRTFLSLNISATHVWRVSTCVVYMLEVALHHPSAPAEALKRFVIRIDKDIPYSLLFCLGGNYCTYFFCLSVVVGNFPLVVWSWRNTAVQVWRTDLLLRILFLSVLPMLSVATVECASELFVWVMRNAPYGHMDVIDIHPVNKERMHSLAHNCSQG